MKFERWGHEKHKQAAYTVSHDKEREAFVTQKEKFNNFERDQHHEKHHEKEFEGLFFIPFLLAFDLFFSAGTCFVSLKEIWLKVDRHIAPSYWCITSSSGARICCDNCLDI